MSQGTNVSAGTIGVMLIGILLATGVMYGAVIGLTPLSSISSYQGIHPSFAAVWYQGLYYTTTLTHEATLSRIGPATMNFDPDKSNEGMPNLMGELRDIQIIEDLSVYEPQATMAHIANDFGGDIQPDRAYRTYEWEVEVEGEIHTYVMELWLCSMEINLVVKPDNHPFPGIGEQTNNRYKDTEVWLRLEASQEWGTYFQDVGVDNTYFGLAYLELAEITGSGDDLQMQLLPMARWAAFDSYDTLGGQGVIPPTPDAQAASFQGATINPNVFKTEWFTKITLADFGTYDWSLFGGGGYKSDSVNIKAIAHIFVVGEWIAQPPAERDLEEHEPPWKRAWYQGFNDFLNKAMSNPMLRLQLALGATVFILVLAVTMYPPLGGMILKRAFSAEKGIRDAVKGRPKRRKKKKKG